VAYHPVIDLVKSHFDIKEGDGDYEIRESGIDMISLSPEARKDRIIEALIRITLKALEIRPLIWAIEDLHWTDKSSENGVDVGKFVAYDTGSIYD
jgi:hypothetical protein